MGVGVEHGDLFKTDRCVLDSIERATRYYMGYSLTTGETGKFWKLLRIGEIPEGFVKGDSIGNSLKLILADLKEHGIEPQEWVVTRERAEMLKRSGFVIGRKKLRVVENCVPDKFPAMIFTTLGTGPHVGFWSDSESWEQNKGEQGDVLMVVSLPEGSVRRGM